MTDSSVEPLPAESTLIRRAMDGDSASFAALVAPHLRAARALARRIVRWDYEVDDIVQESARKALSRLHQFRFESTFGTWLLSIVVNEARMARRRINGSRTISLELLVSEDLRCAAPELAYAQCVRQAEASRLNHAVALLPEKYRQVIQLRFHKEADVRQTAQTLGISVSAVKSRQLRALQMIRRLLPRRDFGLGPV